MKHNKWVLAQLFHDLACKHKEIAVTGNFNVTLTVSPAPPPPLAVASPEDLGPVGGPLANPGLIITGGTPPYVVGNVQGALPDGVTINSDGTFSGVPGTAGSFDITVDVADSLG